MKLIFIKNNTKNLFTCSYKSISFLSGNFSDCIAFNTVSQCPLFISATKPSTLSTVFNDTPVSSYKQTILLLFCTFINKIR